MTEAIEASPYTACHMRDHKGQQSGSMMPDVHALFSNTTRSQPASQPAGQLAMAEFIAGRPQDPACQQFAAIAVHIDSTLYVERIGLFVRPSAIDGVIQTAVQDLFREALLYRTRTQLRRDIPDSAEYTTERD